jgi:hypothetical protein
MASRAAAARRAVIKTSTHRWQFQLRPGRQGGRAVCLYVPTAGPECAHRPQGDRLADRVRPGLYRPLDTAVVDRSPSGGGDDVGAVPDVYRKIAGRPGPVLITIDVDGERFAIRQAGDGGINYDWLSGPNKGYGFASSGTPNRSVEEHREHIRVFLAMIDPNTGYIGDD